MATDRVRSRCRQRLEGLAASAVDGVTLQLQAVDELQRAIGFDRWCWPAADPVTLLPGMGIAHHDYGPRLPRALELEYSGADFATKDLLAGRGRPARSLREETGHDLMRSARWEEVLHPVGIGDVAAVACRDSHGCWAWIEAYRDGDDRPFTDDDLELLAAAGPVLGTALRRRVATGGGRTADLPTTAGVILLDSDLRLVGQTPAAAAWAATLPAAEVFAGWGILPAPVYPAATLARSQAGGRRRASVLNRTVDGGWVQVEAAPLEDGGIAVTLRGATSAETFDLLVRAYGLTSRERQVAALLAAGHDTEHVARTLHVSGYTVQDHLKSVFAKLAVHTRAEVTARLLGAAGGP